MAKEYGDAVLGADEANAARESGRLLAGRVRADQPLAVVVDDGERKRTARIPVRAVEMLVRILDEMGRGNGVAVMGVEAELTTQEAAEMLRMSRPSLIRLLDAGTIAYRKVGSHRRVRMRSVVEYKRRQEAERLAVLEELAAYDQELGL